MSRVCVSLACRVIPAFMCQGGDFTLGDGRGGKSIYGAKFAVRDLDLSNQPLGYPAIRLSKRVKFSEGRDISYCEGSRWAIQQCGSLCLPNMRSRGPGVVVADASRLHAG
jgi:hypothetical protein